MNSQRTLLQRRMAYADLLERSLQSRYPNAFPDSIPARVYTHDAAGEAVRLAGEIVTFVRNFDFWKKGRT